MAVYLEFSNNAGLFRVRGRDRQECLSYKAAEGDRQECLSHKAAGLLH